MVERIRVEMDVEDYNLLAPIYKDLMDIKTIDIPDFDYSEDEQWLALRKKSTKAYKDLKKREFELRNN